MADNVLNRLIKTGKWLWVHIDGKKRLLGFLFLLIGLFFYKYEFFNPLSYVFFTAGFDWLGLGFLHKAAKM